MPSEGAKLVHRHAVAVEAATVRVVASWAGTRGNPCSTSVSIVATEAAVAPFAFVVLFEFTIAVTERASRSYHSWIRVCKCGWSSQGCAFAFASAYADASDHA